MVEKEILPFISDLNVNFEHSNPAANAKGLVQNRTPFSCHECYKVFATKSSLDKHFMIHTGRRPYGCRLCNKHFTQKSNLTVHFRKHSGIFPYQCADCHKGFNRRRALEEHEVRHHRTTLFSCDACKRTFKKYEDLVTHQHAHVNKKLYICEFCEKGFANRANLKVHVRIHTNELPYICNYCSRRFRQNHVLRRHILTHTGERPFYCTTCHKRFSSRSTLKCHSLIHLRQFSCSRCNTTFSDQNSLNKHVLLHSGVYPYSCSLCKKDFFNNRLLQKHQAVHSNYRPFVCNFCEKRFKYKGNLKMHQLLHSNSVHFVCETCGKNFIHKNNFKRHLRTHSGERPYVCNICNARFTAKHSLNMHYLRHANPIPSFKCDTCGHSFRARSTLNYHKLKHLTNAVYIKSKKTEVEMPPSSQNNENLNQPICQNKIEEKLVHILVPVKSNVDTRSSVILTHNSKVDTNLSSIYKQILPSDRTVPTKKVTIKERTLGKKQKFSNIKFLKIAPRPSNLLINSPLQPKFSVIIDKSCEKKLPLPLFVTDNSFLLHSSMKSETIFVPTGNMNQQFYCNSCKKAFKNEKTFKQHRLMHQKGRPFLCSICNQSFTANSSLKRHLQRHTGQPLYNCNICKKKFFQLGNLRVHQQKTCFVPENGEDHDEKWPSLNSVLTEDHLSVNNTLENSASGNDVETTKIGKGAPNTENFNSEVCLNRPSNPVCDQCHKSFTLWTLLKIHKNSRACKRNASCKIDDSSKSHSKPQKSVPAINQVNNSSNSQNSLPKFTNIQNVNSTDAMPQNCESRYKINCQICNSIFSTDKILKRHLVSHNLKKSFKCNKCHKSFKNNLNLQVHYLIHAIGQTPTSMC